MNKFIIRINSLFFSFLIISFPFINGCISKGNQQVQQSTLGLIMDKVSGDQQSAVASTLFKNGLTVRVYDPITSLPIPSVQVTFTETTKTDSYILDPVVTTDSIGFATCRIRAPAQYGQTIKINVQLQGTSIEQVFSLFTKSTGGEYRYDSNTTHNNLEIAGVPFGFIIKIYDDKGAIMPDINEVRVLIMSFDNQPSWGGKNSILPSGSMACSFTNGVCITDEIFYIADSLNLTKAYIGDGPGGLVDTFARPITVLSNNVSQIHFADQSGGPLSGAQVIPKIATLPTKPDLFLDTDMDPRTFFAVATDDWGNYYYDVNNAVWSVANDPDNLVSPYLSTTLGKSTTFVPTRVKSDGSYVIAQLSASSPGLTTGSRNILIDRGDPDHFNLSTSLTRDTDGFYVTTAGNIFSVTSRIEDKKGNLIGIRYDGQQNFSGFFSGSATLVNHSTPPELPRGINLLYLSGNSSPTEPYYSGVFQFLNGQSNSFSDARAKLVKAHTTPEITASLNHGGLYGWKNPLTGSTGNIKVLFGPPNRLNFYTSRAFGNYTSNTSIIAGNSTAPIYIGLEDSVGNLYGFLNTVSLVSTDGAWTNAATLVNGPSQFSIYSTTYGTGSASFSATRTNIQNLTAAPTLSFNPPSLTNYTGSSISGTLSGEVIPAPLSYYRLATLDTNYINIAAPYTAGLLSALRNHALAIAGFDQYNNPLPPPANPALSSTIQLNISYTGATPTSAPCATQPIIPQNILKTYNLSSAGNGYISYATSANYRILNQTFYLPNASDNVVISVVDNNGFRSLTNYSPLAISKGLKSRIEISNLFNTIVYSGTPLITTTDNDFQFQLNQFDSLCNYIGPQTVSSWTNSSSVIATINPTSAFTMDYNTNKPGSDILTATDGVLTTSINPITISHGAFDHFEITTTNNRQETAGTPFQLFLTMKDRKNNTITSFNGSINLSISHTARASIYGNNPTTPSLNGNYTFSAGVITTPLSYTFYRSGTPNLGSNNYDSEGTFNVSGNGKTGATSIFVQPAALDNLYVKHGDDNGDSVTDTSMLAGNSHLYHIYAMDRYGNQIAFGATANLNINFQFNSSLGGQRFLSTTLNGVSGLPTSSSITGTLTNGYATVTLTATQSGTLTVQATPVSTTLTNLHANIFDALSIIPLPTVDSLVWSQAPPTSYVAGTTMPTFIATIRDIYGNIITTNNSDSISITLTSGTSTLQGTLTKQIIAGAVYFTDIFYARAEDIAFETTYNQNTTKKILTSLTVNTGPATKIIIALPGQNYVPGVPTITDAVVGTPNSQVAGTAFSNIKIYITDNGFNQIMNYNDSANFVLSSSDSNFINLPVVIASGTASVTITNTTANTSAKPFTTLNCNGNLLTSITSSNYIVNPNVKKNIVLVPQGQTLISGKSGSGNSIIDPSSNFSYLSGTPSFTVGTPFSLTAYTTDAYFNLINDSTTQITLGFQNTNQETGTDQTTRAIFSNASTSITQTTLNGKTTFNNITYYTSELPINGSSGARIQTTSNTGGYTHYATQPFTVNAGTAVKTIVVLPGEIYRPGQSNQTLSSAVTGTPTLQTAGVSFATTAYVTDTYFNRVPSYSASFTLMNSDPNDTDPTATFNDGMVSISVNNITASNSPNPGTPYIAPTFSLSGVPTVTTPAMRVQSCSGGTPSCSSLNHHVSSNYIVQPNTTLQTIEVLPGESFLPGQNSRTAAVPATASSQTVGSSFITRVYVVDSKFNLVNINTGTVSVLTTHTTPVSTDDPYGTATPTSQTLSSGTASFTTTNYRASSSTTITGTIGTTGAVGTSRKLRATSSANYTQNDSNAYLVNPLTATQAIVVLPNQVYHPGTSTVGGAIQGTPTNPTAGNAYNNVYVKAVDNYFNVDTNYNGTITLTTPNDPTSTAPTTPTAFTSGQATFTLNPVRASTGLNSALTQSIQLSSALSQNYNSTNYTIQSNSPYALLTLLPGQTFNPGQTLVANAITGTVLTQTAGTAFNVNVYAVDNRFNQITSSTVSTSLTLSDTNAIAPTAQALVSGTKTFSVTNRTAQAGNTITASGSGYSTPLSSTSYSVNPGAASQVIPILPGQAHLDQNGKSSLGVAVTGTPTSQVADQAFDVGIKVVDLYFNTVTSSNASVRLSTNDPQAPAYTTPVTGNVSSGQGTLTLKNITASNWTVTASSTGLSFNTSSTYSVLGKPATQLIIVYPGQAHVQGVSSPASAIVGSASNQTAGTPFAVTIKAVDSFFNVDSNYNQAITLSAPNTGGAATPTQFTNGIATFTLTPQTASTGNQVTPSSNSLPVTTASTYTILPGPAASTFSTISVSPSSVKADWISPMTITLVLKDSYNNAISGTTPTLTITGSNNTLSSCSVTNGTGTSSCTLTSKTAQTKTISLLSPVISPAPSTIGTFTAGDADHIITLAGNGQSATAGATVSTAPKVQIVDYYDNPITSSTTVQFQALTAGSSVGSSSVTTDANSSASTSWTLSTTAGSNQLTISGSPALPGSNGLASVTLSATGVAGAADHLDMIAGDGGSATVQTALSTSPKFKVLDRYNNAVTGTTVNFTVTQPSSPKGTVSSASVVSNSNGEASVTYTLSTLAGTNQLTASISGAGLTSSSSCPLKTSCTLTATGNPGAANKIVIKNATSPILVGQTSSVNLEIQDSLGNLRPSDTGSVNLMTTGSATISGGSTLNFSGGTANTTVSNTVAQTITLSLASPSPSGLNVSSTQNVIFNSPAMLSISDGPTYDFKQQLNQSSTDKTLTVTNSGSAQATALMDGGTLTLPFKYKGSSYPGTGGTCSSTLNASSSCNVIITFNPTSGPTSHMGTLTLSYHNGVNSGQTATRALAGNVPAAGSLDQSGFSTSGNPAGTFQKNVGSGTPQNHAVRATAIQTDGKILLVGESSNGTYYRFAIHRLLTDGTTDSSFGTSGTAIVDLGSIGAGAIPYAVTVDGSNNIYVAGSYNSNFALAKLSSTGTVSCSNSTTDFAGGVDTAYATVISGTNVVLAGQASGNAFALAFYNSSNCNYVQKTTTTLGTTAIAYAAKVDSSGKIVLAGKSNTTSDSIALARYTSSGSLDTTFNGSGTKTINIGNNATAQSLVLDNSNNLYVGGYTNLGSSTLDDFLVARVTASGNLDTTFNSQGYVTLDISSSTIDHAYAIARDSTGNILLAGSSATSANPSATQWTLIRLTSTGSVDFKISTAFTSGASEAYSMLIDTNGKIVVGGSVIQSEISQFAAARYFP